MAICRFLPEGYRADIPEKAFVRIKRAPQDDTSSSETVYLRLIYGNAPDKVKIRIRSGQTQVFSGNLIPGKGVNEMSWPIADTKEVFLEFEGRESPDIYGISLESKNGIIVDNIPQRGSAGLEFTMVNRENLSEIYRRLDPELIIMHFGLNVVRNVSSSYAYYSKGLVRQLHLLREILPGTPILLIGVSDMASFEGDSIRSFKNIPAIIKAQRDAAGNTGAIFWDCHDAMGGESSIVRWANMKPPLAQKDFVHFTKEGADTFAMLLAEKFFARIPPDTLKYAAAIKKADTLLKAEAVITQIAPVHESKIPEIFTRLLKYDPESPLIFTSPGFWIFFLFLIAGYSLIYTKVFLRNLYLLVLSLFFYYKSGGMFLVLLLLVIVIDFTCGMLIYRTQKKFLRKLFILISLISNLGILAYFKYTDFFVNTLNDLFGTDFISYDFLAEYSNIHLGTSFNLSSIILPVGISFFTFQSLSYTIDIYRRKIEPVKSILDFGFYVSFFPQLVAGPIVRASEFIPQIYNKFSLGQREFSHAIFLISKGLIKKIVISDFIAGNFIDRVFDMPAAYSGFENLMAVYGYGLQIYCDFSGYTDIAIGTALLLGFRLPLNFNSPYKATGLADFWRRWHISLSRWLKDYLYISLGGNRKGKLRTGLNLFLTMLIGGLWHGASARFVIWGALHGLGLIINKVWNHFTSGFRKPGRFGRVITILLTFNFVSFAWIFFRSADMESVHNMITRIFEHFSPESYTTVLTNSRNVFLLIMAGYLIHFLPERIKESYRGVFIRIPVSVQMAIVMGVAVLLYEMRTPDIVPFIYFRF
jgi:D-alanyl-lipoteichoic acid acyltransferase DltB (MBOAT superfamily)